MPAPAPAPSMAPVQTDMPPMDGSSMPPVDMGTEQPEVGQPQGGEVNAFGKEKFDAGIDVDEDVDPKKFIEQLVGKLAQSLRSYNETNQDPDLNKFAVNSVIPAAVPNMSSEDAKDVIKKVQDNIGQSGQNQDLGNGEPSNNEIPDENLGQESGQESGQDDMPPIPESKTGEIDDLINEILGGKNVRRNVQHKNPFKNPKFK